jgi:hypothetical protein
MVFLCYQKHLSALKDILGDAEANQALLKSLIAQLESDIKDISDLLHTASLVRSCSKTMRELIQSYGEMWSSRSLHAALTSFFRGKDVEGAIHHFEFGLGREHEWLTVRCTVEFLDSREIIHVTESDIGPAVDWGMTLNKMSAWNADVAHQSSTIVVRPRFRSLPHTS